jgi:hypothetical protein
VRARTTDVSYPYRMGAGFAGDINRTHPFSAIPVLMDDTTPIRLYGDAGVPNQANGKIRGLVVADASDANKLVIAGVLVRPYPVQQASGGMSQPLGGSSAPATNQPQDILEDGHIMVKCYGAGPAPSRGNPVFVWCAASAGAHVLGGFESEPTAGSTVEIANAEWVGGIDANGIAELRVWKAKNAQTVPA